MFGIGMTELMVILALGVLVLGPKRLPELASSLGKGLAELRRASSEAKREFLGASHAPAGDVMAQAASAAAGPELAAGTQAVEQSASRG
jgi:TatA/E family protein of Tat protein translocase